MRRFAALACLFSSLAVTAALAASSTLTGRYRIVSVAGADTLDIARARAEFAGNGRFAATVGCNRLAGIPTIDGSRLTFGPMMATRMACVPPLDQAERAYLEALRGVRSYRLAGATLTFLGEDGEALVTLKRTK